MKNKKGYSTAKGYIPFVPEAEWVTVCTDREYTFGYDGLNIPLPKDFEGNGIYVFYVKLETDDTTTLVYGNTAIMTIENGINECESSAFRLRYKLNGSLKRSNISLAIYNNSVGFENFESELSVNGVKIKATIKYVKLMSEV